MANNELQSAIQIIRSKLISSDSVSGLVEDRVYGDFAWVADNGTAATPTVVLEPYGGYARYSGRLQTIDLYLTVFSKTSSGEAMAVYDKVYSALHGERLHSEALGVSGVAREIRRPDSGYELNMLAWWRRARWTVVVTG